MNNSYLQRDSKQESDGDNTYQSTFKVSKTSKIEYLIENEKFDEALSLVDRMLEKDSDYKNWNLKGIILDNLSEYDNAIECFDNALRVSDDSEILINKVNSLYKWAKVSYFPDLKYDHSLRLIDEALEILSRMSINYNTKAGNNIRALMEIANELGISQAQISRIEKNAIKVLKKSIH